MRSPSAHRLWYRSGPRLYLPPRPPPHDPGLISPIPSYEHLHSDEVTSQRSRMQTRSTQYLHSTLRLYSRMPLHLPRPHEFCRAQNSAPPRRRSMTGSECRSFSLSPSHTAYSVSTAPQAAPARPSSAIPEHIRAPCRSGFEAYANNLSPAIFNVGPLPPAPAPAAPNPFAWYHSDVSSSQSHFTEGVIPTPATRQNPYSLLRPPLLPPCRPSPMQCRI